MKHSILLFFYLLSGALFAQYAPFPTPGMEYGDIMVCNPYDCPGYGYNNNSMRYDGHAFLCGYDWFRFESVQVTGSYYYIRTENGKYYDLRGCGTQALMYDFSKNVGDTVITADFGPLKVTNTGLFAMPNGSLRKKMTLIGPGMFGQPQSFTWVDGIGDIDQGFYQYFDFEGGHNQLICLKDSSGVIYHSQTWNLDCDSLLCPEPYAAYDFNCTGKAFHFANQSIRVDTYHWDFGDGESSAEKNPDHTYAAPGCYDVVLTVQTACLPLKYTAAKRISVDVPVYWKKSDHQLPGYAFKIQYPDGLHGWALGAKTIWKTVDGGITWDSVIYPGPSRPLKNLSFSDAQHGIVALLIPGSLYYDEILWTDNGGITWAEHQIGNSPSIGAIERLNDSVALVSTQYSGLFVTKNSGQNWEDIFVTSSFIIDFFPIGGDTVYFAGIDQLAFPFDQLRFGKTTNFLNWQVLSYGNSISVNGNNKICFVTPDKGWICGRHGLLKTLDGGQTWQAQQDPSGYFNYIAFADPLHGWVCGFDGGIFSTIDGGETWQQQDCIQATEYFTDLIVRSSLNASVLTKGLLYDFTLIPDTASICGISAVAEPKSEPDSFEVYPNPTSDEIQIKWHQDAPAGLELVLFNAQGVELMRRPGMNAGRISVANLPVGFYYLQGILGGQKLAKGCKVAVCR
jgi:photosystem II stability/assembly factor-like uncharacterized protein